MSSFIEVHNSSNFVRSEFLYVLAMKPIFSDKSGFFDKKCMMSKKAFETADIILFV